MAKINPKWILACGIVVCAYSVLTMSFFNLSVDYETVLWSRILLGVGMGMVFIPLTTLTLSTIRKEEMNNATGIFNLVRNIGGSFGIAFITTLLARRMQFHQFRFTEHLNIFDPKYQYGVYKAGAVLQSKGIWADQAKNGLIYQRLLRESGLAAFKDVFFAAALILLCILPFVLLLKRPKISEAPVSVH